MSYDFKKNIKDLLIEHKKAKGLLKEQSPVALSRCKAVM